VKYLLVLMLVGLAGCGSSRDEYIKGCIAGAQMVLSDLGADVPEKALRPYCEKISRDAK
jgi:hypothetical protein